MTDSSIEQDRTLAEPFTRESVLARTMDWRQYAEIGLINADQLRLLQDLDKKASDAQIDMITDVCFCFFFIGMREKTRSFLTREQLHAVP